MRSGRFFRRDTVPTDIRSPSEVSLFHSAWDNKMRVVDFFGTVKTLKYEEGDPPSYSGFFRNNVGDTCIHNTVKALSFNQDNTVFENGTWLDPAHPTYLTVPATGWYTGSSMVRFSNNSTNSRRSVWFTIGGSLESGTDTTSSPGGWDVSVPFVRFLNAGDHIGVAAFQNSGVDMTAWILNYVISTFNPFMY